MNRNPAPFLHRIFSKTAVPTITEGWIYSAEEAKIYGGFNEHQAVDFAVPTGTPVLAAADGLAIASFYELPIRYPDDKDRTWKGKPVYWGFGLYILILHENSLLTVYGHLHSLAPEFQVSNAYIKPTEEANSDLIPPILEVKAEDFGTKFPAVKVSAGQLIGYSGITGMGLGQRTYDNWLAGRPYEVCDEEHVHFAVSTLPGPEADGSVSFDPFGIRGLGATYPRSQNDWSKLSGSLWLG